MHFNNLPFGGGGMTDDSWMWIYKDHPIFNFRKNQELLKEPTSVDRVEVKQKIKCGWHGYRLHKCIAHGYRWGGEVTDKKLRRTADQQECFQLTFPADGFLAWFQSGDGLGSVMIIQQERESLYQLRKHIKKLEHILFKQHENIIVEARADQPKHDVLGTWGEDKRLEPDTWGDDIKTIRLLTFWTTQITGMIPRILLDSEANSDQMIWLKEAALKKLTNEQIVELNEQLDRRIKWEFETHK